MVALERNFSPLARRYTQCTRHERICLPIRSFSAAISRSLDNVTPESSPSLDAAAPRSSSFKRTLDPNLVRTPKSERLLIEQRRIMPVGSRRRRAALATAGQVPFEQLPYQCFQEARKILMEDRAEIVGDINVMRDRIARLEATTVEPENEAHKDRRLRSMRIRLERTKIYADINDPLVKKKFEDDQGDLTKPIYRHLADLKWRSYKRKVLVQRIEQMNVVPDVYPSIDPIVSTALAFGTRKIPHGEIVDSRISEIAPTINIQPYDAGDRLVTIAVVTPDVPDVAKDAYEYRCHFLASNIPISPTSTNVSLGDLDPETQVVLPWLPPYSQKGAPYQRLAIFIFEQPLLSSSDAQKLPVPTSSDNAAASATRSITLPVQHIKSEFPRHTVRKNFILRTYAGQFRLQPVGVDLFRSVWDEGTAGVMQRLGVPGWDVEFKRKRVDPLPYQRLKGERYR